MDWQLILLLDLWTDNFSSLISNTGRVQTLFNIESP